MVSYFSHYNGNICNHQQQATANSSNISIVSNSGSSNSDSMNNIQTCKRIAGNAGVETTSSQPAATAEELQQQQQELLPKSGDDSNCDHSKLHRVIEEL